MNSPNRPPQDTTVSRWAARYEKLGGPAIIGLLTAINPAFAFLSSASTLLSYGSTSKFQMKSEFFYKNLAEELRKVEEKIDSLPEDIEEAIIIALDGIRTSVSQEKIQRFAKIIAGHSVGNTSWDETASALKILSGLEDIHISILAQASIYGKIEGRKFGFFIKDDEYSPLGMSAGMRAKINFDLLDKLPGRNKTEIQLFCMELMAKGLLHDNDQGQTRAGPVFTLTNAAIWFLAKIEIVAKDGSNFSR